MNHDRHHGKNGLTLVESLVCLLLLSFLLVSGVNIYFNADEILALAVHKKIAGQIANSKLEELRHNGYHLLPDPNNLPPPDVVYVGGLVAQRSIKVTDRDEPPGDNIVDYKEVSVNVDWSEANNPMNRHVQMTTLIAP